MTRTTVRPDGWVAAHYYLERRRAVEFDVHSSSPIDVFLLDRHGYTHVQEKLPYRLLAYAGGEGVVNIHQVHVLEDLAVGAACFLVFCNRDKTVAAEVEYEVSM